MHRNRHGVTLFSITVSVVLLLSYMVETTVASEKDIQWSFKSQKHTSDDYHVMWKFRSVNLVRDYLKFTVIAHNTSKTLYQCIYLTGTEKSIHMDDEYGNEYAGMQVSFIGNLDNKLAPNQRKKIHLAIPRHQDDVALVNLHFGLYSEKVGSNRKCEEPTGERGYNFHQLDWDVTRLNSE